MSFKTNQVVTYKGRGPYKVRSISNSISVDPGTVSADVITAVGCGKDNNGEVVRGFARDFKPA